MNKSVASKEKIIFYGILVLFVLSLLPLLGMSFFAHQSGDDYVFGWRSYQALANGGNLWDAFRGAAQTVVDNYFSWQGTYSAIFLFALHPGIFGEQYYFLTTFLFLFSLIFGTLFFTHVVMRKYLSATRLEWLTITVVLLTLCIQLLPSPLQAFYWYNGSLYYTFYFSIMLIFFGVLLLSVRRTVSHFGKAVYTVLICFLCAFLGGGNYVTCLTVLLVYLMFLGVLLFQKRLFRQGNWGHLIAFSIFAAGFLINALAPGNQVRQSGNQSLSPIMAVLASFKNAIASIDKWLTLPVIIAFVFLLPFLFKVVKRTQFQFRFPLVISAMSFCLFSSMFCPPLYAMGNIGDDRLVDILYFSFILLLAFNLFYWLGWSYQKVFTLCKKTNVPPPLTIIDSFTVFLKKYAISGSILLLLSCFICLAGTTLNSVTTFSAARSLVSGEAQTYRAEYLERVELYKDPNISEVYVEPYTVTPRLLHYFWMEDIGTSPEDPLRGFSIARYYQKDSVLMIAQ